METPSFSSATVIASSFVGAVCCNLIHFLAPPDLTGSVFGLFQGL